MPQSLSQGEGSAFLVPANGPALALRYGETWIGRGSFRLSAAAQLLCSRRQACLQYGKAGLRIENHGLNPLHFLNCQHVNFHTTQEAESLHKLCKGQSTWLADGDSFYLISRELLLRVVIQPSYAHSQLGLQPYPLSNTAPAASEEVPTTLESSMTHQNQPDEMLKEMLSVVATVTGYKGVERDKLIKLINTTGSAFTGKWTPGHTHLVCWKFTGAKYEMAKRSGKTILLNHRWFEDCLKANCRLPEQPYTLQSGEEVGPLLWMQRLDSDRKGKNIIEVAEEAGPSGTNALRETNGESSQVPAKVKVRRKRKMLEQNVPVLPITAAGHEHSLSRESLSRLPRNNYRRLVRKRSPECQQLSNQLSVPGEVVEDVAAEGTAVAGSVIDLCTPPQPSSTLGISAPLILVQQAENPTVSGSPEYRTCLPCADDCGQLCASGETPPGDIPGGEIPAVNHTSKGSPEVDLACVICYTETKLDKEGVLDCGHKFCFSCIHKWSLEAQHKDPSCPLCKAPFNKIVRRTRTCPKDDSILKDCSGNEEFFVGVQLGNHEAPTTREWACICCHSSDSQDLFCICRVCSGRAIHLFCIDPPGTTVHDDWLCPRCTMHRNRAQNIGDWRRLLSGNDADGPGSWYVSRLDGQPVSRAMRSINMEVVDSGQVQVPNGSISNATTNRPRTDRLSLGRLSRPRRRPRQQRMSSFLLRQLDEL